MRITVIGGNSGTGAHVVRLAAQAGHEVTSLSRTGSDSSPDGVVDRRGDATDPDTVRRAVVGADAVVVTVGGGAARNRAVVTEAV
ncbi:MAG: NAD(P)H-binding protein, partial [Actinomycetota bacterium]